MNVYEVIRLIRQLIGQVEPEDRETLLMELEEDVKDLEAMCDADET